MGEDPRERGARNFLKLTDGQRHQLLEILEEQRFFDRVIEGELEDMGKVREIVFEVRDKCLIPLVEADSIIWLCIDMVAAPGIGDIELELNRMGLVAEEIEKFVPVFDLLSDKVGIKLKAAPPRPNEIPLDKDESNQLFAFTYSKEYWDKLDASFYRTIGHFEDAFRTNKNINLVVVGMGVAVAGYGIIYSFINGLDLFATVFGGLGLGTSFLSYMYSPQKEIQKNEMGHLGEAQSHAQGGANI